MIVFPPLAAAGEAADILVDLFAVLLAAKVGDEVFKRLRQPALVGEILAGVIIGPAVLGLVAPEATLEVFSELGVVFLLFWVGLETRLSDLRDVGRVAGAVGVLGAAIPLAAGVALGLALGRGSTEAAFYGAALVATSVGITSAVLSEMGVIGSREGRVILGAAVVDDVIAMIALAVAVGLAGPGGVEAGEVALVLGLAVGFVLFFALGGTRLMARLPDALSAPRFSASPLLPAVILCLGLAALAAQVGLAAIIGAFLAGMIVAESNDRDDVEREIEPLYAFFPPFFFVFIGLQVELGVFADSGTLGLLAGVTALAVATKLLGAWLGARSLGPRAAGFVGVGMVPRGEVGIIVAGLGREAEVIDTKVFAVIVGMSLLTTVGVPPFLRRLAPRRSSEASPA